jgi:RNase H-fold protein (predicted Holliday junction resolvase)
MNSPYLGVDIGRIRTGVALSENGTYATPLDVITGYAPHLDRLAAALGDLVINKEVKTVVFGLPLGEDNGSSSQTVWTSQAIDRIATNLSGIDIVRWNEYGSSQDADREAPDIKRDAAAAAILLQSYLDAQRP